MAEEHDQPKEWAEGIWRNTNDIRMCGESDRLSDESPPEICTLLSIQCLEHILAQIEIHQHDDKTCAFDTCPQPVHVYLEFKDITRVETADPKNERR